MKIFHVNDIVREKGKKETMVISSFIDSHDMEKHGGSACRDTSEFSDIANCIAFIRDNDGYIVGKTCHEIPVTDLVLVQRKSHLGNDAW